jgi:hypothetical protein
VVAVKLLHAVYAMLKHRQPYNPSRLLVAPATIGSRHLMGCLGGGWLAGSLADLNSWRLRGDLYCRSSFGNSRCFDIPGASGPSNTTEARARPSSQAAADVDSHGLADRSPVAREGVRIL